MLNSIIPYQRQAKRLSACYSDPHHKNRLEDIYWTIRGGSISDKKSADRYDTFEELFERFPFIVRQLHIEFEPCFAAVVDMMVDATVTGFDVDYSLISDETLNNILEQIEDVDHLKVFDESLLFFLKDTGRYDQWFDQNRKSKGCSNPRKVLTRNNFTDVSACYRHDKSREIEWRFDLFELFGVDFSAKRLTRAQMKSADIAATKKIALNYATSVASPEAFAASFPYVTSLLDRYGCSDYIKSLFELTTEDREVLQRMIDKYTMLGTFNPSAICHAGDTKSYNLYQKHKSLVERVMKEHDLWDRDTNAVYILRFEAFGKDHIKVGLSNFNNVWVRGKNIRNDLNKSLLSNEGITHDDIDFDYTIMDAEVWYLGNHTDAARFENRIKDGFDQSVIHFKNKSANFPLSEMRDISGQRDHLASILLEMTQAEADAKKVNEPRFYENIQNPLGYLPRGFQDKHMIGSNL